MRARWPLYVLLASGLTFLASLYLPWQESQVEAGTGKGVLGLLNLYSGSGRTADGWATSAGVAASLAALALVGIATARLLRAGVMDDPPLSAIAFTLGYLTIGSLVMLHAGETGSHVQYRYAYGAYLGGAGAAVALLVIPWIGRPKEIRLPAAVEGIVALLAVGLLVSFLLPWFALGGPFSHTALPGITLPVIVLAAGGVCASTTPAARSGRLLYATAAIAVLTCGAVAGVDATAPKVDYGLWTALGVAIALVAAAAFARPHVRPASPPVIGALAAAAAGAFAVSLFLPWQEFCAPGGQSLGHGYGRCYATTGWLMGEPGAVAGALAIVLVAATVLATWRVASTAETTVGIAVLTATIGVTVTDHPGNIGWGIGYGAYVGFASAAVLSLAALSRLRVPEVGRRRILMRLGPLAAALALFCAVALPLWSVLPAGWSEETGVFVGWYTIAALLLIIHLARRWVESAVGRTAPATEELTVLPLALLALTALELVRERAIGMTWGGGIVVGLCLLLVVFGWIEQRSGLEGLRVPEEVWRVDRLPEPES